MQYFAAAQQLSDIFTGCRTHRYGSTVTPCQNITNHAFWRIFAQNNIRGLLSIKLKIGQFLEKNQSLLIEVQVQKKLSNP